MTDFQKALQRLRERQSEPDYDPAWFTRAGDAPNDRRGFKTRRAEVKVQIFPNGGMKPRSR